MTIDAHDELITVTGAQVRRVAVSSMDNNAYLITCSETGEQLLVDAADEAPRLLAMIASAGDGLSTIVTTHRHHDHVRALREIVRETAATVAAGADDADALPVAVDRRLENGDEVTVGALRLGVVHLRGHTPGSVTLVLPGDRETGEPDRLFTGDSLFPGGPGATSSPENFRSLMDDLEERIFGVFGDDTVVHPGHGKPTTLGHERPHLGEWRSRGW